MVVGCRKSPNLISWLEHGPGWIEAKKIFAHGLIVRFASLDLLRNDVSVLKSTLDFCGSENCAGATEIVRKVNHIGGLSNRVGTGHSEMNAFFNGNRRG